MFGTASSRIVDIGAMDVNGSLRHAAPQGAEYVGVDIEEGPGVDVVCPPGNPLPFASNTFDLAVSTSCFEHDQVFWHTSLEAMRVIKPGGLFYFNAPSNGFYHRYPYDNWRFFPDSGLALARWFNSNNIESCLVESGILPANEGWNDFFAVFSKSASFKTDQRISSRFPGAMNIRFDDQEVLNEVSIWPEASSESQERRDMTEALSRTLSVTQADLVRVKRRLSLIENSFVWRITRPLRSLEALARNRFGS